MVHVETYYYISVCGQAEDEEQTQRIHPQGHSDRTLFGGTPSGHTLARTYDLMHGRYVGTEQPDVRVVRPTSTVPSTKFL